ncbi:MAG: zinc ribbon domain-containing protein [Nanoarchaeota archaeon]
MPKLRNATGLSFTRGIFGTNSDSSINGEYCKFCFQKGEFINPNLTMNEMITTSINHMINELEFPREKAEKLANEIIPKLKRWKKI